MPLLDDADDMRDHLRAAIGGGEHWVLVADSERGHDRLVALARRRW